MMLIPLLVGATILFVAACARREQANLERLASPGRQSGDDARQGDKVRRRQGAARLRRAPFVSMSQGLLVTKPHVRRIPGLTSGARQGAGALAEAFPHLELWIPSGDAIYQATRHTVGRKGPDIVLNPAPRAREFSDAA